MLSRVVARFVVSAGFVLGALVGVVRTASAQDARCASLYESVQTLRQRSKLLQAREAALACASGGCPKALASDCSGWLSELEPAIPRVVFEARDEQGAVLTDVRVSLDDKVVAERIQGRTVEIDPGEHTFRFRGPDGAVVDVKTVVIEGEKSRRVSATFPSAEQGTGRRVGPFPIIWGGVSVLGFGLGTTFGILALREKAQLDREDCRPFCAAERGVSLSNKAAVADVGLSIGLIAAVAAVSSYFLQRPQRQSPALSKRIAALDVHGSTWARAEPNAEVLQACRE